MHGGCLGTRGNMWEHLGTPSDTWEQLGPFEGPWGREGTIPQVNQINIHG